MQLAYVRPETALESSPLSLVPKSIQAYTEDPNVKRHKRASKVDFFVLHSHLSYSTEHARLSFCDSINTRLLSATLPFDDVYHLGRLLLYQTALGPTLHMSLKCSAIVQMGERYYTLQFILTLLYQTLLYINVCKTAKRRKIRVAWKMQMPNMNIVFLIQN